MTSSRDTTATSKLTDQPITTGSEEWRAECKGRAILKMSKSAEEMFFNGRKDESEKTIDCGLIGTRGTASGQQS